MRLQGSIHRKSNGIGYGAFVPTDRAYYNVSTPTVSGRRPSSEQMREYRRNNFTCGIDTHRSDISFGRTTESIRAGDAGDLRAREATRSLTSGEVGGFRWPAERAREGDVEAIVSAAAAATAAAASSASVLASSLSSPGGGAPPPPSMMLSVRSTKQHEQEAEKAIVSARNRQKQQDVPQRAGPRKQPQQHGDDRDAAEALSNGCHTQRSDSTFASSSSLSSRSCNSLRLSSFRSSVSLSPQEQGSSSSISGGEGGRRTRRPTSSDARHPGAATLETSRSSEQQLSHRSGASSSSVREQRLRPTVLVPRAAPTPSTSTRLYTGIPGLPAFDPVFDRHHKYDLIAEERAARGGEVTGRFGKVHGSSVRAASLLTSELSTPWSHVLRGQKW